MRILLTLILLLCSLNTAFADEYLGINLKTTFDRTPIRVANNKNAARFAHLRKDVLLYATGILGDFYKIDLGNGEPYFVEKVYVKEEPDVIFSVPKYRIKNYKIKENKEFYTLKIKFNAVSAYQTLETNEGLDFNLFNIAKSPRIRWNDNFKTVKLDSTFKFKFIAKQPLIGYGVEKEGNHLILKIRKMPKIDVETPLKGIKIVLDAGHGGNEPGACANGIIEKNTNLQITKKLEEELERLGAKVYMTREKDVYLDLYERVDFARDKEAIVLLSIHANSLPNPKDYQKKHGAGVYYYNKQSKPLAAALQKGLLDATSFQDDGVNYASFALNRPTEMLSVLIETGYVIHPWEAKMLADDAFQNKIAKGIANALEGYFRNL